MTANISSVLEGWSNGYMGSTARKGEMETRQGKNYYFAVVDNWLQVLFLGATIETLHKVSSCAFLSGVNTVNSYAQRVFPVIGLGVASVNHDHYEVGAVFVNKACKYIRLPDFLPEKLSAKTKSVCRFLAENMGFAFEIGLIVSSIALIVLGNPYYGLACLAAVSYGILDTNSCIPRKISLFMQTYMPTVGRIITAVAGGGLFVRGIALLQLSFYVFSGLNKISHAKIDSLYRSCFGVKGPSVEDMDAPWVESRKLSFKQIQEILFVDYDCDYELNVSHLTKQVCDAIEVPESEKYDDLLTLFDRVSWSEHKYYALIRNKLKDDNRFLDFLKERFPEIKPPLSAKNADVCLENLGKGLGLSKESYAASWLREQVVELVDVLMDRIRVKGSQADLADALKSLKKVIPYLEGLANAGSNRDMEDTLLKISVDGGGYCGAQLKMLAKELEKEVVQGHLTAAGQKVKDPLESYEFTLKKQLQELRMTIMQEGYQKGIVPMFPAVISQDVHGFNAYRDFFAFGFHPMTDYERNDFNVADLVRWEFFWRAGIYRESADEYLSRLDSIIDNKPAFYNHMRVVLREILPDDDEYDKILEPMMEIGANPEELLHRYARLLWVILGVIKKKN